MGSIRLFVRLCTTAMYRTERFFDPDEAIFSGRCYPRTLLRGCKGPLLQYEGWALRKVYTALFGLVPLHIANMIVALLCANHVTRYLRPTSAPSCTLSNLKDLRKGADTKALPINVSIIIQRLPSAPRLTTITGRRMFERTRSLY